MDNSSPALSAGTSAVQAHLAMMQDVIRRMADNSRSCKLWCVTLVSAALVLAASREAPFYAPLALVPTIVLGLLDAYYLSLEQRFRNAYNDFVDRLHRSTLDPTEVFVIKPSGSVGVHIGKSLRSTSVWPFYLALAVVIVAAMRFV